MPRVPLTKLHPAPWNPRQLKDARFQNLCKSIEADPGLLDLRPILARRVHPTQKPVALAGWVYETYGKQADLIFDPFLGSGMSLIAAERTVYGCELSPAYCDVIVNRWQKLTGKTAVLETASVPALAST